MTPGLGKELVLTGLRLERPTQSHWIRLIVSDAPVGQQFSPADFWDGTGQLGPGMRRPGMAELCQR